MNQGMFGFPRSDQSDLSGMRKLCTYMLATVPTPGVPTRTASTWYQNTTGEDMPVTISVNVTGAEGGFFLESSDTPNIGTGPNFARPLYYAGVNTFGTVTVVVPPYFWYRALITLSASVYSWTELRRSPFN
jgi:hypothetical protein